MLYNSYEIFLYKWTAQLKQKVPSCRSVISAVSGADADIKVSDYQPIFFGNRYVYGLHTPG